MRSGKWFQIGLIGLSCLLALGGIAFRVTEAGAAEGVAPSKPTASADSKLPYVQREDVVFGQTDGVALVMDIFTPTGTKNGLGIVDVASGAWHSDRGKIRDHKRGRFYDIFCGKGYTVYAIRPGSISKFSIPEMVANIRTGVRWVRDHAGEYGIEPNKMGISGASAGGHLACLTVVSTEAGKDGQVDQPFQAVAVFFPPTDLVNYRGNSAEAPKDERWIQRMRAMTSVRGDVPDKPLESKELLERLRKISPALLVERKQPPFLLIHGDADPFVPLRHSQILVEALKKAGGSAELIVKHGGGHPWLTLSEEVKIMADWFDKQLKPQP